MSKVLTAYWIQPITSHGPLGFGVTARSLDEAVAIIRAFDYGMYLPDDMSQVGIIENVTVAGLEQRHVATNMGPITIRGLWYPFVTVGMPQLAEERLKQTMYQNE